MSKSVLSIIVPCYNEANNIPLLLQRFEHAIGNRDIELILVNNGSTDHSADMLRNLSTQYPFFRTVKIEKNRGYGFGIVSGLRVAQGEYMGWTHADLQTDPEDVIRGLDLLLAAKQPRNTMLKGERHGRPFLDRLFTLGMSLFESLYLGRWLWDINAQPNLFHRSFFEQWQQTVPDDFSLDLFVFFYARKLKLEVKRLDVIFPRRIHGTSSWNSGLGSKWRFIRRTLKFSAKLKRTLGS